MVYHETQCNPQTQFLKHCAQLTLGGWKEDKWLKGVSKAKAPLNTETLNNIGNVEIFRKVIRET